MIASIFQALFSLFSFPKNMMKIFPEYQGRMYHFHFHNYLHFNCRLKRCIDPKGITWILEVDTNRSENALAHFDVIQYNLYTFEKLI